MADDKGKTPDSKKVAEGTEAVKKFAASQRDFTQAIGPNIDALKDWDLGIDKARADQERLTDVIREQMAAIKQQALTVGSLQSQFKDLGNAATGYLSKLKETISLTKLYETAIHKVQTGQKAYNASLQASTSSLGKAAAESTRFVDAYSDAMKSARKTAIDFNLNMEEMEGNFTNVYNALVDVTSAYPDMTKATSDASNAIFKFSRRMGVDMGSAQEYLTNRLNGSVKSLGAVQKEMLVVTKEADTYTNKIKAMGEAARQAGTVTRQGFLKVLQEIETMFKGGMYTAAEGFAKTTGAILVKAKEMGFTPEEAKSMASSFGKVFGDMAKFDNIFGARVAQHLGEIIKDVSKIQDENLRKRLQPYVERAKSGELNVVDLKGIADAARGSSEGMRLLINTFKTSGMAPDVMRSVLGEAMGPGQQHIADALVKLIQEGKMEEAFDMIGAGSKDQKEQEDKQLNFWEQSMDDLLKEGHSTTKAQWQTAIELKKLSDRIFSWFKDYPLLMAGIMAAASLGGNVLGGLIARGGGAAAAAAGGAGVWGAGTGLGAAAGTALAVPGAALGGLALGHYGGKALTNWLAGDETKRRLGAGVMGDGAGLGDWAGKAMAENKTMGAVGRWAFGGSKEGAKMLEETTGIRGVLTEAHKKEFEQNAKSLEWARKNWETLSEGQRDNIKLTEKRQAELRTFIKQNTWTPEERKAVNERLSKQASTEVLAGLTGTSAKRGGEAKLEDAISEAIASSGRIGSVQGGAEAIDMTMLTETILRSGVAQSWMKEGIKEADIKKMIERQLVMKQFAFADTGDYAASFNKKNIQNQQRMVQENLRKLMSEGGMGRYSSETIRAISEVANDKGGGTQLNVNLQGGGETKEASMTPGPDGKIRIQLPSAGELVLDANGLPSFVSAQQQQSRQRTR